jgi:hypothetical protein
MNNEEAKRIVSIRDELLRNTDWTQMPDSPLNTEKKAAFAEYRQGLRDITKQEGFPSDVQFPAYPS